MVNNCTSACTFTDVNLQESLALLTMLRTRLHVKETINILNVFFLSRSEKVRQIFVLFIYISLYCVTNENLCCNVLEDTLLYLPKKSCMFRSFCHVSDANVGRYQIFDSLQSLPRGGFVPVHRFTSE